MLMVIIYENESSYLHRLWFILMVVPSHAYKVKGPIFAAFLGHSHMKLNLTVWSKRGVSFLKFGH